MATNGEVILYDAIVVGARCAGAPLAVLLARQGARVLLVDRATFPRDITHGHFIHRHETNIAEVRFTLPMTETWHGARRCGTSPTKRRAS